MGVPRTGLRNLVAAAAGAVIAALLAAPAAQASLALEVFLQEDDPSNQPVGDWISLSGASTQGLPPLTLLRAW
jgi:H+/Cl- antiporter ClcA